MGFSNISGHLIRLNCIKLVSLEGPSVTYWWWDACHESCSLRALGLGFMRFLSTHYFTITFERTVAFKLSHETQQKNNDCQSMTRGCNARSKTSDINGRESSSLPIPIYLISDIFLRLPLKSMAICHCVSKLCASILRRPDFTELYLTKSSARPQFLSRTCNKPWAVFLLFTTTVIWSCPSVRLLKLVVVVLSMVWCVLVLNMC